MSDDLVDRLRADAKFMDDRFGLPAAQNAATVAANEITRLRAQLAAAEADRLAAMERVREAVLAELIANMVWMPKSRRAQAKAAIRALDLDALAEGEK